MYILFLVQKLREQTNKKIKKKKNIQPHLSLNKQEQNENNLNIRKNVEDTSSSPLSIFTIWHTHIQHELGSFNPVSSSSSN